MTGIKAGTKSTFFGARREDWTLGSGTVMYNGKSAARLKSDAGLGLQQVFSSLLVFFAE